jgi:hypothetical protein
MNLQFLNANQMATQQRNPVQRGGMSPFGYRTPMANLKHAVSGQATVLDKPKDSGKKMRWGEPTWFLFHTLAEKVNETHFRTVRQELLNNIYAICSNLPCPDCANHAKAYLDGINFNAIQTKEDLRRLFHTFHNVVNQRKGYPLMPYEELGPKYTRANTVNMIRNFMEHFSDRHRSVKLLASDLHRSRMVIVLKDWFNKNIMYFDP